MVKSVLIYLEVKSLRSGGDASVMKLNGSWLQGHKQ